MKKPVSILLIIILSLMIVHTLIYIAYGLSLLPFPFDYDQAEGHELNNAVLIASGACPYCDNDVFPFYGSGYPPLFHLLMVPFVKLFGPQFWYGRLIIFSATFITAGAIGWAVFRESKHRTIALAAGLAFLASNTIYHIGPLLRQHLLMVMFETLAVVIAANAFEAKGAQRARRLFMAFALLFLAGYTKQLAYATCIAVVLWTFLRSPRTAIRYSLGLLTMAAVVFGLLMLITDNHWWTNIILANQNPYILEQFIGLLRQFLRLHWWLAILAIGMVIYELYFDRLSVYSVWFAAALANTAAAGKWGAGDSYFATALAAICILSGLFLAKSVKGSWRIPRRYFSSALPKVQSWIAVGAALMFLGYSLTVFKMPTSGAIFEPIAKTFSITPLPSWRYPLYDPAGWTVGYAITGHLPSQDDYDNGWQIISEIHQTDGLLLSEDVGFNFRSQRDVIANAVHLKNLWENGHYNSDELVGYIESQKFGLIILRARLFPPPALTAIETWYAFDSMIPMNGFHYELWRPKSKSAEVLDSGKLTKND